MANAFTYIHNLGKSVKYSAVDVMKDMNPSIASFIETNKEGITDVYKSIKNIKATANKTSSRLMDNEYTEFAKEARKNLMEDIATGKFYNKSRLSNNTGNAALKAFGMDLNDDPFDEDFGFNDDFNFNDDNDSIGFDSSGVSEMTSTMDTVGEKTSTAISNAVARSAQYTVAASKEATKVIYDQNNAIFARLNAGMGSINTNISTIVTFASQSMVPHFENSKLFFEKSNELDQERNELLKQILELQKSSMISTKEEYRSDSKITYDDIVDSNGMPDLAKYAQVIKDNILGGSGGMGDMVKMAIDTTLEEVVASPLKFVTDSLVKTVIPGILKDSMGELNKTLSGLFGSTIMKLNSQANGFGLSSMIARFLGIDDSLKTSLDTSKYNKGKVDFDGITRKSIIEVIPTYLSKILSAMTNTKETRYDYEKGKFISMNDLKKEMDNMVSMRARSASSDITDYTDKYKKELKMSKKDEKAFDQDLQQILLETFKRGEIFDFRNKSTNAKSYNLKNGKRSDKNIEIIKEMFEQMPRSVVMQYANEVLSGRASHTREMERIEAEGAGALTNLYNNSDFNIKSGKNLLSGSGKLNELVSKIYKELSYIRQYGLPNTMGFTSNEKEDKILRPDFNTFKVDTKPKSRKRENQSKSQKKATLSSTDDDAAAARQNAKESIEALKEREDLNKNDNTGFFGKLAEAQSLTEKASVIMNSINDLTKKPAMFLAGVLEKVDNRLFDLIYGPQEDKDGTRSISGLLFKNLKESFTKFNNWMNENIFKPLSEKLTVDNAKNVIKRFFGIFDIDIDSVSKNIREYLFGTKNTEGDRTKNGVFGGLIDGIKDQFKGVSSYIKNAFKDVFKFFDFRKTKKGKSKSGEDKDIFNSFVDEIKDLKNNGVGEVEQAATGMRRVKRTGVVAVSEGEMIVPPDMNPYNIEKRRNAENEAISRFKRFIGSNDNIEGYNTGTKYTSFSETIANLLNNENIRKKIKEKAKSDSNFANQFFKRKEDESDYEDKKESFSDSFGSAAKDIYDNIKSAIGADKKQVKKESKIMIDDVLGTIKKHAPEMITGGIIGSGVSLVTGAIGGPLLGAAAGASIGLIKNSDKVQKWLFGEEIDGERQGGLISKDLSNNIQKYFPDMAKGATVGGITSILPFVPGGPVAGIVLGSAIGFAKNNSKVQEYLFGEDGVLGKEFPDKVKKALPYMGLGAATGLVAGPFGVATNMLIGSVGGFALSSEKFQDYLFGEKDEEGNRTGGLVKTIKEKFEKNFIEPAKYLFDPIKKQFEIMGKSIFNSIERRIRKTIDGFNGTLMKFLNSKFMKPITSLVGTVLKPAKAVAKAPGKVANWAGDRLRKRHIRKGNADYMTADQRRFFEESFGMKRTEYSDLDTVLMNMDEEDLDSVVEGLGLLKNSKKETKKMRSSALSKVRGGLAKEKDLTVKQQNHIMDMLREGNIKGASKYASKLNLENQSAVNELIASQGARLSLSGKSSKEIDAMKGQITEALNSMGVNVNNKDIDKFYAYAKAELKSKRKKLTPEEEKAEAESKFDSELNKRQQKRYDSMMEFIKSIDKSLKILSKDGRDYEDDTKELLNLSANATSEKQKNKGRGIAGLLGFGKTDKEPDKADGVAAVSKGEKILSKKEAKKRRKQLAREYSVKKYATGGNINFDNNDDLESNDSEGLLRGILKKLNIITNPKLRAQSNIETTKEERKISPMDSIRGAFDRLRNINDNDTENDPLQNSGGSMISTTKNTITTFVNGMAMRFRRNKDNSMELDNTDSETMKNKKILDDDRKSNKAVSEKISELASGAKSFFGKFFSLKNKEEEEKPSIFEKIGSIVKKAFIAATLVSALPILKQWWDDHASPVVTSASEGISSTLSPIIDSIKQKVSDFAASIPQRIAEGVQLIVGGLSKVKDFIIDKLPYVFQNYIIPYYVNGMDFLLGNVVPKVAEVIGKSLPTILSGFFKGVISALKTSVTSILNNRPDTDPTSGGDYSFTSNVDGGVQSAGSSVSSFFGGSKGYAYKENPYWSLDNNYAQANTFSGATTSATGEVTGDTEAGTEPGIGTKIADWISGTKKSNTQAIKDLQTLDLSNKDQLSEFATKYNDENITSYLSTQDPTKKQLKSWGITKKEYERTRQEQLATYIEGTYGAGVLDNNETANKIKNYEVTTSSKTELPLAFKYVNKKVKKNVEAQYRKLENTPFTIDNEGHTLALRDILNSTSLSIGQVTNNDTGEVITIYGVDILKYPDVAKEYGINIPSSDSMLLDENKGKNKKWKKDSIGVVAATGLAKAAIRGNAGALPKVLKTTGKLLDNKLVGKLPMGIGTATRGIGKSLKGFASGLEKAADSKEIISKKAKDYSAKKAAKEAIENSPTTKYIDELMSSEAGQKKLKKAIAESPEFADEFAKYQKYTKNGSTLASKVKNSKVGQKVVSKFKDDSLVKAVSDSKAGKALKEKALKFSESGNKGVVSKILSSIKTKIINFISNSSISSFILKKLGKEGQESALKQFATKFAESAVGQLAKKGAQATAKMAAAAATLMASTVVQAVAGFYSGYRNANSILGVTEQPSIPTRLLIGVVSACNEVFLLGIIPMSSLFDIALACGKTLFNINTEKLDAERQAAADEVKEYNREHGTNLTVEEYNKRNRLSTKVINKGKELVGKAGKTIKGGAKKAGKAIKKTAKKAGKAISNTASKIGGAISDKFSKTKKATGKAVNKASKGFLDQYNKKYNTNLELKKGKGSTLYNALTIAGAASKQAKDNTINAAKKAGNKITGNFFNDDKIRENLNMGEDDKIGLRERVSTSIGTKLNQLTFGKVNAKDASRTINGMVISLQKAVPKAVESVNKNLGSMLGLTDEKGKELSLTEGAKYKFDKMRKSASKKVTDITSSISNTWDNIKDKSKERWESLVDQTSKALDKANENLGAYFGLVDDKGKELSLTQGIKYNYTKFKKKATDKFNSIVKSSNEGLDNIKDQASKRYKEFMDGTKKSLEKMNENLGSMFGMVDKNGKQMSLTKGIKYNYTKFKKEFTDMMKNTIKSAKNGLKNISETAKEKFKEFKENTVKALNELNKNLGAMFGMVDENGNVMSLTEGVKHGWDNFRKSIAEGWSNLQDGAKGIWDKFTGFMSDVTESFKKTSDNEYSGSGSGLPSGSGSGLIDYIKTKSASGTKTNKKKQTFVSQLDSKYANRKFNTSSDTKDQTIKENGCGPAAATMVVNATKGVQNPITMEKATREALPFKVKDGGVTADYFKKVFTENGLQTKYIINKDTKARSEEITDRLKAGQKIVLMGKDPQNTSKSKSPFGPNDHYVVANKISGKYIYINDPESKTPNKKYLASKILGSTEMGVAGFQASGSAINNKINKEYENVIINTDASATTSRYEKSTWDFFKGQGFTDEATAGIMGNLKQESGINPTSIQGNGRGPAAGIAQWESYSSKSKRWKSMANYCKSKGKNWTDLTCQLEYLIKELEGADSTTASLLKRKCGGLSQFKNLKDYKKACKIFEESFERAGKPMMSRRYQYAQTIYNKYKGTSSGGGTGETIWKGTPHSLSSSEAAFVSTIINGEGGSYKEHAEALASHMANLYESKGGDSKYGSLYKWLKKTNSRGNYGGGWYNKNSAKRGRSSASDAAVQKCIVNGKRKLPFNVIEFDFYKPKSNSGDIKITSGESVTKAVCGKTRVHSNLGAGNGKFYGYFGDGSKNSMGGGNLFWVPDSCKIDPGTPTIDGSGSSGTSTKRSYNTLLDAINIFDEVGAAYGLTSLDTSSDSSSDSNNGDSTTVSGVGSEKQKELVNKMLSVKGKLKYSMTGPRNPDKGSADCSSVISWAYNKVLGVSPGATTLDALNKKGFTDVDKGNDKASSKPHEDKLQLGDILLFSRPNNGFTAGRPHRVGHIEMYMGNGKQIGHGSGMGPKVKPLQGYFIKARRYNGFMNNSGDSSASGSGLLPSASGSGLLDKITNSQYDSNNYIMDKVDTYATDPLGSEFNLGHDNTNDNSDSVQITIDKKPKSKENKLKRFAAGSKLSKLLKPASGSNIQSNLNNYTVSDLTNTVKSNFNLNDLLDNNVEAGNLTNISINKENNGMKELLIGIIKILTKVVTNTDSLNTIVTLLTKIITLKESSISSAENADKIKYSDTTDSQKREYDTMSVLKQNLINTLNQSTATTKDQELLSLIQNIEKLARE